MLSFTSELFYQSLCENYMLLNSESSGTTRMGLFLQNENNSKTWRRPECGPETLDPFDLSTFVLRKMLKTECLTHVDLVVFLS